jgi:hypothetical protein
MDPHAAVDLRPEGVGRVPREVFGSAHPLLAGGRLTGISAPGARTLCAHQVEARLQEGAACALAPISPMPRAPRQHFVYSDAT